MTATEPPVLGDDQPLASRPVDGGEDGPPVPVAWVETIGLEEDVQSHARREGPVCTHHDDRDGTGVEDKCA